jgi:hypothetical protein
VEPCVTGYGERIKALEGHRNQWRRIAWRLHEELRKHDAATADGIIDDDGMPSDTTSVTPDTKGEST